MSNYTIDDIAKEVAEIIGGIGYMRVADLIRLSNEKQYMFHGIKTDKNFDIVEKEGIEPYTPESNYASHWTTGTTLFGKVQGGKFLTHDSSFFMWAHARDSPEDYSHMNMAVTKYSDLKDKGMIKKEFTENGEFIIKSFIPRNLIHLLRVEYRRPKNFEGRRVGQEVERHLFELIYRTLDRNDYKPGALKINRI